MADIVPLFWFDDQAEEAANYYVSIFKNSKVDNVSRYGESGPGPKGAAMMVEFTLGGKEYKALNGFSGEDRAANAASGIALFATFDSQDELDSVWDALLKDGEPLQCGWLRDKYGHAWNIVPEGIGNYVAGDDPEGAQRAMQAMLGMIKLDINELKRAYENA
ncbi:MAG TPA: VOC family protein [Candidatus Baltobacteraceae bacterium]|nr:VOC family protein [Candidatus Baltobacteraceae bacterium]